MKNMMDSPQQLRNAMDRAQVNTQPDHRPGGDPRYVAVVALVMAGAIHLLWGFGYLVYISTTGEMDKILPGWVLMGTAAPFFLLLILNRWRPEMAMLLGLICFIAVHYGIAHWQGGLGSLLNGFIPRVVVLVILLGGWLNCRGAGVVRATEN